MELQELCKIMQDGFSKLEKGQEELKNDIVGIKKDIRKIDIKIEEIDKKADLALEGQRLNAEQLNIIKEQVTKHEEFIIRRVK